MDRRGFLKASVGVIAGAGIVSSFEPSKPIKPSDFKPDDEYGNVVYTTVLSYKDYENPEIWDCLKQAAYEDMLKVVPAKYRYRIQFRTKVSDYGRALSLCWYYPPKRLLPLPVPDQIGGYSVI